MKNLKLITLTTLAIAIIASIVLVGCRKEEVKDSIQTIEDSNPIKLSKKIIELDNKLSLQKPIRSIKGATGYAVADGQGAIAGFKLTAGYCGPAYGAAFGFLGAIAGSWYHGWQKGDYLIYTPPGNSISEVNDLDSPLNIGQIHNNLLYELFGNPKISTHDGNSLLATSYDYLIHKTAIKFILNEDSIRGYYPLEKFINAAVNSSLCKPINIKEEVANGTNLNYIKYINEFLIRFENPNANFDDLLICTDYFIENVDAQSDFTFQEKYNIKATISVFKSSLLFWRNI